MITICYKITLPKKSGFALGECEIEVNRMRQIADNFPGAVLAFCTLRSTLTNREKRLLPSWQDEEGSILRLSNG